MWMAKLKRKRAAVPYLITISSLCGHYYSPAIAFVTPPPRHSHEFRAVTAFGSPRSTTTTPSLTTIAVVPVGRRRPRTTATTVLTSLANDGDDNDDEILGFESLGLSSDVQKAVADAGWIAPTPIQRSSVPAVLNFLNEDCEYNSIWSEAPTGSGKTGGYVLPLLDIVTKTRRRDQIARKDPKLSTLILVPTRELANQISSVITQLSHSLPPTKQITVTSVFGGVPLEPQILALSATATPPPDILVATPGRLVDVLRHNDDNAQDAALERRLLAALDAMGRVDASLSLEAISAGKLDREDDDGRAGVRDVLREVRYLVIDEADRLLGKGFEKEMADVLEFLPRKRGGVKTCLFSATFPEMIQPRIERVLAWLDGRTVEEEVVAPPLRLSAGGELPLQDESMSARAKSRSLMPAAALADTITLRNIRILPKHRTQALLSLINESQWDRVLVFVATRYAAEHVAKKLRRKGIFSSELHGKLDQEARERRWRDFSRGKTRVLVATDLASRGLDVEGLPAVVNYDLPRSTADFTHRIGRTGRAGKRGMAVTFVTPTGEAHFDLIEKRHLGGTCWGEREVLDGFKVDEDEWRVEAAVAKVSVSGVQHSVKGLAHDKMYGGIKGRRKNKKDKLREKVARKREQRRERDPMTEETEDATDEIPLVPAAEVHDSALSSNLENLTVPALKDRLREKGLKVSGKKHELIERLQSS